MDYTMYVPTLLPLFGAGLQWWVHQHKAISNSWLGIAGFIAAGVVYCLCHTFTTNVRLEVIQGLITSVAYTSTVLGGTFTMDKMAQAGVTFIPKANSK